MEIEYRTEIIFVHEEEDPIKLEKTFSCENDFFNFLEAFGVPESEIYYENEKKGLNFIIFWKIVEFLL